MNKRFSSHTTLIELTLSLLVLMLASVTILGLFTTAYEKSCAAGEIAQAVQLAQDCAALIAAGDDSAQMLAQQGYVLDESGAYTLETEAGLQVRAVIAEEQTKVGKMIDAQIAVLRGDETLASQQVSRYYNKEVIHP